MTVEENSPTEEQPEESVEEPETTPEVVTVEPDPLLQSLYGSDRTSIQLCDGVPLAPVVCTVWPSTPPEKLLQENWIPEPAENEEPPPEDAPPPPSFDPTDLRFQELPWRLSKSAAMKAWCSQKRSVEELEAALVEAKDGEEKQAQEAKLEEVKAKLEEAAAALEELKASFEPDASSLVPWMRRLFAYADAGITSFEAGAVQFPVCDLRKLFGQGDGQELVAGTEKLLGTFKRRFEMERGAGTVQVFCRLLPNTFREGFVAAPAAADDGEAAPSSVEAAVDRMRANLGASPDAPASTLDLVQVNWWDFRGGDVLAVLRELARLGEPKTETDEGTGEVTVVEPAKVAALGLVDFPYRAVLDALQAGIKLACVQLPYNLACRDTAETLALCKEYGVQVLMRGGSLSGLVDERFVGVPRPNAAAEVDGLSWPALALEEADLYGGWPKAQLLLRTIKAIADKHRVKMQTVAMRWQLDQGGVPMFTATLSSNPWSSFGARWLADDRKPGADSQLFHSASFLDDEDLAQLAAL